MFWPPSFPVRACRQFHEHLPANLTTRAIWFQHLSIQPRVWPVWSPTLCLIQHDRIYICWFFNPSNLPNINCVLLVKFKRVRKFLLSTWLQLWISRQRQSAISDWITLSSEAWSETKECARNGKWKYVRMTSFQLLFVINNVCIKITPMVFAAI